MKKYRDSLFARLVLRKKLLSKEKMERLLKEVKVRQKQGESITLEQLLVLRGFLTKEQASEIRRYLEKDIVLCPQCRSPYDASHYKEGKEFQCKKCGAHVTIQSEFSDTFKTTVKLGALLEGSDDPTFEELTQSFAESSSSEKEESSEEQKAPSETSATPKAADAEWEEAPTLPSTSSVPPESKEPSEEVSEWEGATIVTPSQKVAALEESEGEGKEGSREGSAERASEEPSTSPAAEESQEESWHTEEQPEVEDTSASYPEEDEDVELPFEIELEAYRQVVPRRPFPVKIHLEGRGLFRIRCHFPATVTTPDYRDVLLRGRDSVSFWILPLACTPPTEGTVEVWHNRQLGQSHIPFRSRSFFWFRFVGILFLVFSFWTGLLCFLAQGQTSLYQTFVSQYEPQELVQWVDHCVKFVQKYWQKDANQVFSVLLALVWGGLGLVSLILYLLARPKTFKKDSTTYSVEWSDIS